jgi:hypothetical protein
MQTSIEWLINELKLNDTIEKENLIIARQIVEEAKFLHKQEIKKSYEDGKNLIQYKDEWGERYYNETFKKEL